eukprot:COSAG02_NODE_54872_length_293_cov_1.592784_1_plen_53_part_01
MSVIYDYLQEKRQKSRLNGLAPTVYVSPSTIHKAVVSGKHDSGSHHRVTRIIH